jgi:hypothetical protein
VPYNTEIKVTGIFLLLSGWIIVLASLAVLPRGGAQSGFAAAGGAVEGAGLILLFRAHGAPARGKR